MFKWLKKTSDKASHTLEKADQAIDEAKGAVSIVARNVNDLINDGNNKVKELIDIAVIAAGASLAVSIFSLFMGVKILKSVNTPKSITYVFVELNAGDTLK